MARLGYGNVSVEGFVAFGHDLDKSAWKDIDVTHHGQHKDLTPHLGLSVEVFWKLQVEAALAGLSLAVASPTTDATDALDTAWDRCQKRLHLTTALAQENKDPATRDAAGRVRDAMLAGEGTAQTGYEYNVEVDFGRKQVRLAAHESLAKDIKKLGLTELFNEIGAATEALASAIGRGGVSAQPTRSKRVRAALSECASACNAVHCALDWLIDRTPPGDEYERLLTLRAPFEALLARHAHEPEPTVATATV